MYAASPLHARSLFLFVTGATPGGTMGRLSTTECTYLPTFLEHGLHQHINDTCILHFSVLSLMMQYAIIIENFMIPRPK